jgi:hypothetical protein
MEILVLDEVTYSVVDKRLVPESHTSGIFGRVFTEIAFREWVDQVWKNTVDFSIMEAPLEELSRVCNSSGWAVYRRL